MGQTNKKNLGNPDETRNFPSGKLDVVKVGDLVFGKATFQPGWKWSECIKPIAGTESCQVHHVGTLLSGHMHVVHDDGTEQEVGPGQAYTIDPGHDAWVVGDEPVLGYEFEPKAAETFAKG